MMYDKLERKIDLILRDIEHLKTESAISKTLHETNAVNLAIHIKRTNKLESQQQKIIYLLWLGAGIGVALYGPAFIKLVGIL